MKLHQLSSLIALADTGSVRGAAKLLGLTQPTVTARIAELEHELGAALINRTPYGSTVTPVGHALLLHARAIENQVRRAAEEVAYLTNRVVHSVAIGVSPLAATEFVAPVLEAFRAEHPRVELRITEGLFPKVAAALRDGDVDFVVSPLPRPERGEKGFHFEELVAFPNYVVGRMGHRLREARRLSELLDAHWVVGARTSSSEATVEELFQEYGLPKPLIAVHADSAMQVQAAVAATDLLAVLPRELFAAWPGAKLVALPIRDAIRPVRFGIICRAGDSLSPVAARLADLIREQTRRRAIDSARERTAI